MKIPLSVLLLVCAVAAFPLSAQTGIWFGPQMGFYQVKELNETHGMFGLAMRMRLSDGLGIEGSVNYRREDYADGYVSVKNWPVMLTGMLYPIPFLYGALGAGWYNSRIDYAVPTGYLGGTSVFSGETRQRFGWHFGGGVELTPVTSLKLVADVKYVFLDYKFQEFPGSNGVNSNYTVLSFGMLFAL